jgi:hypothetical protein
MSTKNRASQFRDILNQFFALHPDQVLKDSKYSDFDGPNVEESIEAYEYVQALYLPLIESKQLEKLPWTTLNGLQGQAQNVANVYQQLLRSRDQGTYQNFAGALDNFAYHTRMFGIPFLAAGGDVLEATRASMAHEIEVLTKNNADVERLKESVRTLITPAVAGSLSKSFTERRDSLRTIRYAWLGLAIVVGGLAIFVTYAFADTVSGALALLKAGGQTGSLWPMIAIRSIVLLPIFAAVAFTFSQYRKERNFEEEYAHKAAVAASLPNYGDLAREPGVRDQIVTAAAKVIFSSPTDRSREEDRPDVLIKRFKDITESVGGLLSKR